jgi:hypothetical protein
MKTIKTCLNLGHKAILGAVLALRIFLSPRGELKLP